jgi:hypothetical protein
VGILPFSFDRLKNTVKRSRALECYSFLYISVKIIYVATYYIRVFIYSLHHKKSDGVLLAAIILQSFSVVLNLIMLLICLVSNRQAIVDLVNDGLKIEQDFQKKCHLRPWNLKFYFMIFSKDIIYIIGHTYFAIFAKRNDGELFHCFKIVLTVIYSISTLFAENLKIISLFRVSHLLGRLNKSLSQAKRTGNTESIQEISKMYDRLLTFAENICKLLRFRTTTTLIQFLVMISTEVQIVFNLFWNKFKLNLISVLLAVHGFCIRKIYSIWTSKHNSGLPI